MGGKRGAKPSGDSHGKAAASGDAAAAQGGASRKRQTRGQSVGGGAGSVEAGSCGQEGSFLILAPVTMCLSIRCDPSALAGRKAALEEAVEAAVRKVAAEFGGRECRVEWTRVGPSKDTLQRVLPMVLERLELEGASLCFQVFMQPPSLPPYVYAPLPSLPLTSRPAHILCCLGWSTRESRG